MGNRIDQSRVQGAIEGEFSSGSRDGSSAAPLDFVAGPMFALPYDAFLIEWEDQARAGDFSTLQFVPRGGPVIVLGVISTENPRVESRDSLPRRIDDATTYLDIDQLASGPQCGFASVRHASPLGEADQRRILELLGRVADRACGRSAGIAVNGPGSLWQDSW